MQTFRLSVFTLIASSFLSAAVAADGSSCALDSTCQFRFPTSSQERLDPDWLVGLPPQVLWEARNEIMARHGYAFETPRAVQFFGSKPYYRSVSRRVSLSPIEQANVDLIKAFEDGRGSRYLRSASAGPQAPAVYDVVGLDPHGDNFLSVRAGPGGKFPEIGRIHTGDRVTVTASSGKWRRFQFGGREGWSHSGYLSAASQYQAPPAAPQAAVQVQIVDDRSRADELQSDLSTISSQIADLSSQLANRESSSTPPTQDNSRSDLDALRQRIADLESRKSEADAELRSYATPIEPQNKNLQVEARRSSERFQKVPYFVPGTKTVGEMWLEPSVDDKGDLHFNMNFIDPEADYQKIAIGIPMTPAEIGKVEASLESIEGWSATATQKKIRKRYEKEALCLPEDRCQGERSTGLQLKTLFQINDDGSTATIIRTRQGTYERSFGFSMESTSVLRDYIDKVTTAGKEEFQAGTATKDDLDGLFK